MTAVELKEPRSRWAKFIRETSNIARYLWPSGTLISDSTLPEESTLRDFLNKVEEHDHAATILGIGYHLSLPEVRQFLLIDLASLVRHLGHASATTPPETASAIRGKVLWPGTILGRLSGQVPKGQYLVRSSERQVDTPENQLLKRYLVDLVTGLDALAAATGSNGTAATNAIRDAVLEALLSPYLHSVTLVGRPTAQMVAKARRDRNARYGQVAKLSERLRAVQGGGKWAAIAELLAAGWVAPVTGDDLFELFCLVSILDALEKELGFGTPKEYDLIWRGRRHVALFSSGGVEVFVHFNISPNRLFGAQTRYNSFTNDHQFYNIGPRRPDITIVFRYGDAERRFIVEAKDTIDATYARSSVYKVFGYVYDFAQMWSSIGQTGLKAVILFPEKVSFAAAAGSSPEVIALSATDREGLTQALNMMKNSVLELAI